MNTRQKKKQYKKRYGHNPPKGADGRYLFHVTYGLDLAAAQALADFAAAISQGFSNMADMFRGRIEEQEEPPVVVARHLAERRRKCRKEWKASKR